MIGGVPLPENWWPDPKALEDAAKQYPYLDVPEVTQLFVRCKTASGELQRFWIASWRGTLKHANNSARAAAKRGGPPPGSTQLPDDWTPPAELTAELEERYPSLDLQSELWKFRLYFGLPGRERDDWARAWTLSVDRTAAKLGLIAGAANCACGGLCADPHSEFGSSDDGAAGDGRPRHAPARSQSGGLFPEGCHGPTLPADWRPDQSSMAAAEAFLCGDPEWHTAKFVERFRGESLAEVPFPEHTYPLPWSWLAAWREWMVAACADRDREHALTMVDKGARQAFTLIREFTKSGDVQGLTGQNVAAAVVAQIEEELESEHRKRVARSDAKAVRDEPEMAEAKIARQMIEATLRLTT